MKLIVILHFSPPSKTKIQTNFPDYTKTLKVKQTKNAGRFTTRTNNKNCIYKQDMWVFFFACCERFLGQSRFRLLFGAKNSHIACSDRGAGFSTCSCRLTDGKQRKQACCANNVLILFLSWGGGVTNRSSRPRWSGAPAVCPA